MLKKRLLTSGIAFIISSLPLIGHAAGNPDAGKTKSTVCAACHGVDGDKALMPSYPNLAGQNAAYLELALKAYRSKTRTSAQAVVMHGQAANLSDQDIADLAAYYSSK